MNYTIKKNVFLIALPVFLLISVPLFMSGCIIQNAQPEDCEVVEVVLTEVKEGSSYDIVFSEGNKDFYYINRGLEQGLTIEDLQQQVLNKKVTLHLYKLWYGTSEHISQLSVDGNVLFTEFN